MTHAQLITRNINAARRLNDAVSRVLCLSLPDVVTGSAHEWIPYLPAPVNGRITGQDGRSWPWSIDEATQLVAITNSKGRKLPVDVNHSTDLLGAKGLEAPAYGYIVEFRVHTDGSTWARVDWNERGRNAMAARDYAYISPFFDSSKATGRIVYFAGASLVNDPNFTDLPALNGRQSNNPEANTMDLLKLLALLGLPATGGEADVERGINTLKSEHQRALNAAQTPDLTRFVPRSEYDAEKSRADNAAQKLADLERAQVEAQVDVEIDAALRAGKIAPASVDFFRANCLRSAQGLEEFRRYVSMAPQVVPMADRVTKPAGASTSGLTDVQRQVCRQMGIPEADYAKQIGTTI